MLKKFKRRLTFLCCTQNLENVLDSCKVADFCVFLTSVAGGEEQAMNPQADLLLTSLRSQGLPSSMGLIQSLDSLNAKQSAAMRKYATRLLQSELGVDVKVFDDQHVDQLLRSLCDSVPSPLFWRQMRSYLLAEEVEVRDGGLAAAGSPVADLSVRGYLHGVPLSLYDRIHITGEGSHTIRCIRILPDPSPLKPSHGEAAVAQEWVPDQNRVHPIEEENPVDPNSVEAPHWAIPEVGQNGTEATADNTEAIWREVVGDELYEDEEDRHAHEALMALDQEMALDDEMSEQEDFEVEDYEDFNRQNKQRNRVAMTGRPGDARFRVEEERKEDEEAYWESPDETEVPYDQPARFRFLKYRGLQSFRNSPWDPKENLPVEYASLYQFEDYAALLRALGEEQEARRAAGCDWEHELEDGTLTHDPMIEPGSYVEIVIADVSRAWMERRPTGLPVVCSALLPHEEKLTVMHGSIQRSSTWYPQTVKSRDLLVAHMGFRHFLVHPLFADVGLKCDKSKYIKYLPPTGFFNCTFYAPMSYRPCPLLLFKPRQAMEEDLTLVGIGQLTKAATDDIVLKKVVLTGTPFKVKRKLATVRHMFLDPKDIFVGEGRGGELSCSGSSRSSCTRSWGLWDTSESLWERTGT